MNDRELLKLALEALEYHVEQTRPIHKTSAAIDALRAALAAAVDDKPRAWIDRWGNYAHPSLEDTAGATPLYTRPAAVAEPVALKRYAHYCSWDGGGTAVPEEEADGEWVRYDDAQALLKAVAEPVATGFKLVPLEPTPEMAKAGCYRYCAAFVKDYKAMLSAAPAAPPQREPQWQPIETAPRDGTRVLIHMPEASRQKVLEAYWATPWEGASGWWSTPHGPAGRGYMILQKAVTHWMPLPDAPASAPKEQA